MGAVAILLLALVLKLQAVMAGALLASLALLLAAATCDTAWRIHLSRSIDYTMLESEALMAKAPIGGVELRAALDAARLAWKVGFRPLGFFSSWTLNRLIDKAISELHDARDAGEVIRELDIARRHSCLWTGDEVAARSLYKAIKMLEKACLQSPNATRV